MKQTLCEFEHFIRSFFLQPVRLRWGMPRSCASIQARPTLGKSWEFYRSLCTTYFCSSTAIIWLARPEMIILDFASNGIILRIGWASTCRNTPVCWQNRHRPEPWHSFLSLFGRCSSNSSSLLMCQSSLACGFYCQASSCFFRQVSLSA